MIDNIDEAIQRAYERELRMIAVNGGGKDAVQFREEMLKAAKQNLQEYLEQIYIDFFGREKALNEAVIS